jgi:hypothetical protein
MVTYIQHHPAFKGDKSVTKKQFGLSTPVERTGVATQRAALESLELPASALRLPSMVQGAAR